MSDFNYGILQATSHRPWAMPDSPWLMRQSWHDLLFAHWPIDSKTLRRHVPAAFEIDVFEGQAWLSIVPFRMSNVTLRFLPAMPWVSAFPELNVRTYVRVGKRPGVCFFSLDAANPLAVAVARRFFHLPYFTASMTSQERDGWIQYRSDRTGRSAPAARFVARYRHVGPVQAPVAGSLDHFLTERYCLYTVDATGVPCTVDIHHPPWPLQSAEAVIETNTMAEANGLQSPVGQPVLHFSKRQDVVAWGLRRC